MPLDVFPWWQTLHGWLNGHGMFCPRFFLSMVAEMACVVLSMVAEMARAVSSRVVMQSLWTFFCDALYFDSFHPSILFYLYLFRIRLFTQSGRLSCNIHPKSNLKCHDINKSSFFAPLHYLLHILFEAYLKITNIDTIIYDISVLFLLCFRVRLFIDALRSPAGKGLTSWLSFVMSNCEVVTFPLVPWVRCSALLHRFLIFVLFLTLS